MSKDHARSPQLQRALNIVRLLGSNEYKLAQLARAVGVTTRTVRRDLAALQMAGVPVIKIDVTRRADGDELDEDAAEDAADWPTPAWRRLRGGPVVLRLDVDAWHAFFNLPCDGGVR